MSEKMAGDVFRYWYLYNGKRHWMDLNGIPGAKYGVNHADDLMSLFYPFVGYGEKLPNPELCDEDESVALRQVRMYVRFAQADGGSEALQDEFGWDPVTVSDQRYLRIDTNLNMEASDYYKKRIDFWKSHEPYY